MTWPTHTLFGISTLWLLAPGDGNTEGRSDRCNVVHPDYQ